VTDRAKANDCGTPYLLVTQHRKELLVPTLLQLFTDPISIAFFAIVLGIGVLEALFPARRLPTIKGHRLRGALSLLGFFLVSSYLPYLVGPWLAPLKLAELSELGTWGGAACATLLYQAFGYAYHRSLHRFDALFRIVHQAHHSAERLDVPGAFLFGPLDMVGWTLCSTLALSILGLTPESTTVFVLFGSVLSTFQHANLRTPRWLGYFVQRPESHSVHHARGVHRNNYADLPVFDLIFGTFENPGNFAAEAGFYDGASARVTELLLFRDVTRPRSADGVSQGSSQRPESAPVLSRS
jgi:sterol desaturase/sphingolipid hydroxylase (fatty acid hydroxylase superfamily)